MNFKEALTKVRAFVFDFDGVFSKSVIYLHPTGEQIKTTNTKDGFAIHYAVGKGYPLAIITGGVTESVKKRLEYLGVKDIYLASGNKLLDFRDFVEKYNLSEKEVLYMGDDIPDYEVMQIAGVPTCPADAVEEIKALSIYISDRDGGEGCIRDVIEQVLRAQGNWVNLKPVEIRGLEP